MGGIDVLVNNAGTSRARPLDELTDDEWRAMYELHVLAPMRLMRAAAPRMAARGGGRIVNVCLVRRQAPVADERRLQRHQGRAALALARLRRRLRGAGRARQRRGARARRRPSCGPRTGGIADQTGAARGSERARRRWRPRSPKVPLGRFAEPREIADVIVFLCSARASTVTGAAWSVDGGTVAIIV